VPIEADILERVRSLRGSSWTQEPHLTEDQKWSGKLGHVKYEISRPLDVPDHIIAFDGQKHPCIMAILEAENNGYRELEETKETLVGALGKPISCHSGRMTIVLWDAKVLAPQSK